MGRHKTSKTSIEAIEKKEKILALRLQGLTFQEIGDRLGLHKQRAWEVVMDHIKETQETMREEAVQIRAMEIDRLDRLFASHFPVACGGRVDGVVLPPDSHSAKVCLQIMDRRARYLGLDMPQNHAVNLAGEVSVKQPVDLSKLTDDEIRMMIALNEKCSMQS